MEKIILQEDPFGISIIPVEGINPNNKYSKIKNLNEEIDQFKLDYLIKTGISCLVRGTHINNLETILSNGIDVIPTDSPIYCSESPEKALEYGWDDRSSNPKMLLLFYDMTKLERTFKEISSKTPQTEIDMLIKTYPTIEKSVDGEKFWLSRLQKEDKRRTTPYEMSYGYWIPRAPVEALKWIFLLGSFSQQEIIDIQHRIEI